MAEGRGPLLVAVVDDQEFNRRILRLLLERAFDGLVLVEGSDGRDAVAIRFAEPAPDLMIVNGLMPGMGGPEAIAEIRRLEAERGVARVPIAISSMEMSWQQAGLAAGADGELALPVANAELFSLVSHALRIEPLAVLRRPAEAAPRAAVRPIPGPRPVPRFPMEIRVDAAPTGSGRRTGTDEDGHRWASVPTYGSTSAALKATFGFDCPVYEARHAEVWEAEEGGRRTGAHRSLVVQPA